jgi:hypothetical protein
MYNVAAISTGLVEDGGKIFTQMISEADFMKDLEFIRGVKIPIALPKIEVTGGPRPYAASQETSGNAVVFSDRQLVVNQSKMDFPAIDVEIFRNKYLAKVQNGEFDPSVVKFSTFIAREAVRKYLAKINDEVIWSGSYNAAGSTTAAIATGFGTIIAAEIVAGNLTPYTTGAITAANAVTKVEEFNNQLPSYLKSQKVIIDCSYDVFQKYRTHYRTLNAFAFKPNERNEYQLDGSNTILVPRTWMGSSQRLVARPDIEKNLYFGVDADSVQVFATPRLNLIDVRLMMPLGMQIGDIKAIWVNDQA